MPIEAMPAETVEKLIDLAAEARGIDILRIENEALDSGLPEAVPIGLLHGKTPQLIDLKPFFDRWRERPTAKRGTASTLTVAAFVALTNRHKTRHSAIFADTDWRKPSLTAVIDYHEIDVPEGAEKPLAYKIDPGGPTVEGTVTAEPVFLEVEGPRPDNLAHRIGYAFPLSEPWKAWVERDGVAMSQSDFAAWIEDHIMDLAAPTEDEARTWGDLFQTTIATPSTLVQLSRGLQVAVEARLKNVVTLQSGAAQMVFEEEHRDADGRPLVVPGLFLLSVPAFFGGEPVRVPVRLRYRASGGRVTWFYQVFRPDEVITAEVARTLTTVRADTALPVYEGTPEV